MFAAALFILQCLLAAPPDAAPHKTTGILIPPHQEQPDEEPAPRDRSARAVTTLPAVVERGPFRSVQVNVEPCTGRNFFGDAANEPSIAVDPGNPNRIAIGWRQFDDVLSNFRQAGWAYTSDGGDSWTFTGTLDPFVFRSDPVLAADPDGTFLYYSLQENFTCDMYRSTDLGRTWDAPIPAFGGDKAWIAVDPTDGIGRGNVYAFWSEFAGCCPGANFTRSTNRGATYRPPFLTPSFPIHGTMTVGPDGALYIGGSAIFPQNVVLRSCDAQDPTVGTPTFDLNVLVDLGGGARSSSGPNPGGLLGQCWIASDHSNGPTHGNIYLLQSVDPPGADQLDVMFARSTDGGLTWTPPIRVNDDPQVAGAFQWFGTMSVAPNGRIDVIWNDTRNDLTVQQSELYYTYSFDAGDTWATSIPVSPPFNHFLGYPNQSKLGDYYDMISDDRGANLAYAATFNGEQDVYFLQINANDCNSNGIIDVLDLAGGTSVDANDDGNPDECGPSPTFGDVLFVDAAATGDNDASSWTHAATNLQAALALATIDPQISEIRVAQGFYRPTAPMGDRTISFAMLDGVTLKGGYYGVAGGLNADQRDPAVHVTVLTGDLNGDDTVGGGRAENSYHVLTASGAFANGVLDGFLITGGNADGDVVPLLFGGGLYVFGQCPIVRNCTFQDNIAWSAGGAVYAEQANVRYENCRFDANFAGTGGAMYNRDTTVVIDGCRFTGNHANISSGGAMVNLRATMELSNSGFSGNTAVQTGGAIRNGVDDSPVTNCTFAYNHAGTDGGGIFQRPSNTIFRNCIFWNNSDAGGTDESAQIHVVSIVPVFKFGVISGGWSGPGNDNTANDPLFVNLSGQDGTLGTDDDDFQIAPCSPAVDAGTSGLFALSSVDESGLPRVVDGDGNGDAVIDIGAAEQVFVQPPIGDLNGDGLITVDDFATMIGCFGGPGQPVDVSGEIGIDSCQCAFDTDLDQDVDLRDFSVLVNGLSLR